MEDAMLDGKAAADHISGRSRRGDEAVPKLR